MTGAYIRDCQGGCGSPVSDHLTVRYRYPRTAIAYGALDPCHVVGAAPVLTCGSVGCQAAGVLAAVDRIILGALLYDGQLLASADVKIVSIGPSGEDFTWAVCDGSEAA